MGFAEVSKFDENPHATFYAQRDAAFERNVLGSWPFYLPTMHRSKVFTNAQSSCTLSVPVQPKYIILFIDFNLRTCSLLMEKILFSTWEVFILSPGYFICCTGLVEAVIAKYITCLDHSSEVWA